MPVMETGFGPLLVSVEVIVVAAEIPTCVAANLSVAGLRVSSVPAPVSVTICGLPAPVSVTVSVPVATPLAVGTKATFTVHPALPGPICAGQVFVWVKGPLTAMLETVIEVAPQLLICTWFAALVVPTTCGGKATCSGEATGHVR